MNEDLQWFQRLHWRGAFAFLIILIVVEVPLWGFARTLDFTDPDRAMARALGLATFGAVLSVAIHTVAASIYMRRRIQDARRVVYGAVAGERVIRRVPDEVSALADEVGDKFDSMRTTMVRLQQERGRLRTLLEGMEEAVLMFDDAERVLVANSVAEKLLNLPDSYAGRRISEVCEVPRLHAIVSEVLWAHEASTIDLDLTGKHAVHHLSVTASPIMGADAATGAVVVMHDHTQLRLLERIRRDFVANVSHELRTPIASIRSASETLLLADLDIDPQLLEFLRAIERNSERMGTIVEDLLVLSRLEAAGEDLDLHEVSLVGVFAEIVDQCDPMARAQGVSLDWDVDEELPTVYAEEGALRQIIQNLVENGIKYTPTGGSVTVKARTKGSRRVRVIVCDTGPGIPTEHLPRIFERFYRVDMGRSREIGGTGLGLAIVKHLARKLKARIDVESEPAKGTTFKLMLRVYRPEKVNS